VARMSHAVRRAALSGRGKTGESPALTRNCKLALSWAQASQSTRRRSPEDKSKGCII